MDQSKMNFLQSVLKYSTLNTEVGSSTDKPSENPDTNLVQMDPERKKWLDEALSTMNINPDDEMKKCMKCLREENDLDRKLEALETLRDWCEDMNFAIDLYKMNGYELIPILLKDEEPEIRALTCDLVGTCAQNNEYSQETFITTEILSLMLKTLENDNENSVKVKALFAISCIARDYLPSQKKLIELNGLDIVIQSLQTPLEKLQIKSSFFCSSICSNPEIKTILTEKCLLQHLVQMYSNPNCTIHEHVLSAINVLIDENPAAIKQAKNMKDLNLKVILKNRLEIIRDDPRYLEEKEMATKIFEGLFQN